MNERRGADELSGARCGEGFFDACGGWNQRIGSRELEKLHDVGADTDGDDANTTRAAADEVADDEAQSRGIESGNLSDIEDVEAGKFFARGWIEVEDIDDGKRLEDTVHLIRGEGPRELEDECIVFFILNAFDGELGTLP